MSEGDDGRYKIIRTRQVVRASGTKVPVGKINRNMCSYLTDKVAVSRMPEKVKKLAYGFGELGDGLRLAFLEKDLKEDPIADVYRNYENILNIIGKTTAVLEPELKDTYLAMAEKLLREMKNELPAAPSVYWILGKCLRKSAKTADEFIERVIKAKDDETLPKICRSFSY